jgi:hypothetical protein
MTALAILEILSSLLSIKLSSSSSSLIKEFSLFLAVTVISKSAPLVSPQTSISREGAGDARIGCCIGRPSGLVDVRTLGTDGLVSTEFLSKAVFGLHDVLWAQVQWGLVEERISSSPSIETAMPWSPCVKHASSHFVPRTEPGIVASLHTAEPNTESVFC